MEIEMEYPTQARVAIYDFNAITMTVHWFDTYKQALKFTRSFSNDKKIIVGGIDIIEVIP